MRAASIQHLELFGISAADGTVPADAVSGVPGLTGVQGLTGVPLLAGLHPRRSAELIDVSAPCVPDREGHLHHLAAEFKALTMGQLSAALDYTGPVELLSMHLCIFMARPLSPRRKRHSRPPTTQEPLYTERPHVSCHTQRGTCETDSAHVGKKIHQTLYTCVACAPAPPCQQCLPHLHALCLRNSTPSARTPSGLTYILYHVLKKRSKSLGTDKCDASTHRQSQPQDRGANS